MRVSISFSAGTDSPVNAASSAFKDADSIRRQSAGTESPASRTTISPTTRSSFLMILMTPSRITLQVDAVISFKASIAFSALPSCTTPRIAFKRTTPMMIKNSASSAGSK